MATPRKMNPRTADPMRGCDACKWFSEQMARVNKHGKIEALCLNFASDYSGKYRREESTCYAFERGPSVDLPEMRRTA
jgi:hypothetical protein